MLYDFKPSFLYLRSFLGLCDDSYGNESACYVGDLGSISGSGKIPGRRERLPTPVFLPREFHGQRSLAGYNLWDCKESDTTKWLTHFFVFSMLCEIYPLCCLGLWFIHFPHYIVFLCITIPCHSSILILMSSLLPPPPQFLAIIISVTMNILV